jgi:adenine-specific DNA-methyltransferase
MPQAKRNENKFTKALTDVFVGAKVEGESGYINLMKIKTRYFQDGVMPRLLEDIDAACAPFEPAFREELFDKLYDFFSRYFSESGSIYFRHTAYHQNVYERVYTDDRDVMLFWKTHMLYYVKADRLFKSMDVDVDGVSFRFDVSGMEHKRSNEKRDLIYTFREATEGKVTLAVAYSEKGRKTPVDDILKAAKKAGVRLHEEMLERACRVFEKQSEVDYFINKDARAFLREQFDLWLYQYVFSDDTHWTETRLRQLQALKDIAYKIIDFVAQFEDELVRIWNKPKFVLNSHYVITLDKITDSALLARLLAHPGMTAQVQEWRELGMIDDGFDVGMLSATDLTGAPRYPAYQFLSLDTRYVPDLELDILSLFDDLDEALDGWLVHSENYQALNTLLPRFKNLVQAIYIDPPYNTVATEIAYENHYRHSSWLTLVRDRLALARSLLATTGILCVTIDDYELSRLSLALDEVMGEENYLATTVIRNNPSGRSTVKGFAVNHEYGLFYAKAGSAASVGRFAHSQEQISRYEKIDEEGLRFEWVNLRKSSSGSRRADRPKQYFPFYYNQAEQTLRIPLMQWDETSRQWDIRDALGDHEEVILPIDELGSQRVWNYGVERASDELSQFQVRENSGRYEIYAHKYPNPEGFLPRTWWDDSNYSARDRGTRTLVDLFGASSKDFEFPKAVKAVEDSLKVAGVAPHTLSMDFFAGSGTTAHAVINLNREDGSRRKYILVEMGEHFHTVILPRVKKVVFSDKWKDGAAQPGQGISHFAKYYDLEQYEDALRRASYADAPLLAAASPYESYVFLRDKKLLEAIEIDHETDHVRVDLSKLYDGIDLAETLSCVTGKGIRRITRETVTFQDGTTASLTDPDWSLLKPLLWW